MTTDAHKGLRLEGALGLRCHSKVKIANLTNNIHFHTEMRRCGACAFMTLDPIRVLLNLHGFGHKTNTFV